MNNHCSQLTFKRRIAILARLSDSDNKECFCKKFIDFTRLIKQVKKTNPRIHYSINHNYWLKINNYLDSLLVNLDNEDGSDDFYIGYNIFKNLKQNLKFRRSLKNNPFYSKLQDLRAGRLTSVYCDTHKLMFKSFWQLYEHIRDLHK